MTYTTEIHDANGHDLVVGDWVEPTRHSDGQRRIVGFHQNRLGQPLALLACGLCIKTIDIRFLREG